MNGTLKHLTQRSKKLEYIKGTLPAALLNSLALKSHFPQKIKINVQCFFATLVWRRSRSQVSLSTE